MRKSLKWGKHACLENQYLKFCFFNWAETVPSSAIYENATVVSQQTYSQETYSMVTDILLYIVFIMNAIQHTTHSLQEDWTSCVTRQMTVISRLEPNPNHMSILFIYRMDTLQTVGLQHPFGVMLLLFFQKRESGQLVVLNCLDFNMKFRFLIKINLA